MARASNFVKDNTTHKNLLFHLTTPLSQACRRGR
jgi:hypothetical protein